MDLRGLLQLGGEKHETHDPPTLEFVPSLLNVPSSSFVQPSDGSVHRQHSIPSSSRHDGVGDMERVHTTPNLTISQVAPTLVGSRYARALMTEVDRRPPEGRICAFRTTSVARALTPSTSGLLRVWKISFFHAVGSTFFTLCLDSNILQSYSCSKMSSLPFWIMIHQLVFLLGDFSKMKFCRNTTNNTQ